MKDLSLQLVSLEGMEIDCITLDKFGIAEPWDDAPALDNETIMERVEALFESVLTLLRERQAAPHGGVLFLKLALGEALLTADESEGDVVLQVKVDSVDGDSEEENADDAEDFE
jgi:hypothetical protein